jgi:DNA-binding transcriptional regulator YiaG
MAGDWIKWAKGLARKPEVVQIAIRLGLSRHAVAGLLMEVWEWADENVVLNLSGSEPDDCPGCVPFEGTPEQLISALTGVTGLADAMTAAGWLRCRSGSLVFPNFNRHNGNTAKSRALDSSRKQRNDLGLSLLPPAALLDDHARLTALCQSLAERCAGQNELLSQRAESTPPWGKTDGKAIRKQRNDLGLSLLPPAEHLGVSVVTLSKWERSEGPGPTKDQRAILARFYQELAEYPATCLDFDTNEEKQSS